MLQPSTLFGAWGPALSTYASPRFFLSFFLSCAETEGRQKKKKGVKKKRGRRKKDPPTANLPEAYQKVCKECMKVFTDRFPGRDTWPRLECIDPLTGWPCPGIRHSWKCVEVAPSYCSSKKEKLPRDRTRLGPRSCCDLNLLRADASQLQRAGLEQRIAFGPAETQGFKAK